MVNAVGTTNSLGAQMLLKNRIGFLYGIMCRKGHPFGWSFLMIEGQKTMPDRVEYRIRHGANKKTRHKGESFEKRFERGLVLVLVPVFKNTNDAFDGEDEGDSGTGFNKCRRMRDGQENFFANF